MTRGLHIITLFALVNLLTINTNTTIAQTENKTGICISFDGKTMIYIVEENQTSRFYQSNQYNSDWGNGVAIDELNYQLDSLSTIKNPFLSYDGKTLYFSAVAQGKHNSDIYYSQLKNGKWQKPSPMPSAINSDEDEEHPSVTADNRYFYFTRKAIPPKPIPDDEACRTIYCATRGADGKWQTPIIIKISNTGCETYPLIFPDGKTLVFSSNKLPQKRKRKYDIYYASQTSSDIWSLPQAIDSLNSEGNEISPTVDYTNKQIYALRVEQIKKETKTTIISYPFPNNIGEIWFTTISGKVLDKATDKNLKAEIKIYNATTSTLVNTITTHNGNFAFMLPNNNDYRIDVGATGYSTYTINYNLNQTKKNQQITTNIELFSNIKFALNVYDKEVFSPLNAKITITESGNTKNEINVEKQNVAGRFIANLSVGKIYTVKILYTGYTDHIFKLDFTQANFSDIEEDIALVADKKQYSIFVTSDLNGAPLDARVEIFNSDINETINVEKIKAGEFSAGLRKNSNYDIKAIRTGYSFDNRSIKTNAQKTTESITIKLIPLSRQTKIALSAIKFADNAIDLATESYDELNYLTDIMLENPEVTIEIGVSTTDNKADAAYSERLTAKQARSISDYLIMNGVVKERITTKGFGKTTPDNIQYSGKTANKNTNSRAWFTVVEPAREWVHIVPTESTTTQTTKKK